MIWKTILYYKRKHNILSDISEIYARHINTDYIQFNNRNNCYKDVIIYHFQKNKKKYYFELHKRILNVKFINIDHTYEYIIVYVFEPL